MGVACALGCVYVKLVLVSIKPIILDINDASRKSNLGTFFSPFNDKIVRYDDAFIRPISGTARSHALPNAVPMSRAIPRHLAEDITYHISQRHNTSTNSFSSNPPRKEGTFNLNHDYSKDFRTLYLYNPSVLPLHNTILLDKTGNDGNGHKEDPDFLSKSDLLALTGGDPSVRYVAIYRAYLGCNCFGPLKDRRLMIAGEQVSYVALTLLDENLDVVNGTDILFDINFGPGDRYWRQSREDCRISLLRGSIYLLCNDDIHRVRIRRAATAVTPLDSGIHYKSGENDWKGGNTKELYVYRNIHGTGLEVTLLSTRSRWPGRWIDGKNMNIFRSPARIRNNSDTNTGPFDYYMQIYPSPHWFSRLNIPPRGTIALPGRFKQVDEHKSILRPPPPSFDTPDTPNTIKNKTAGTETPFFDASDRGTACCVSINLSNKREDGKQQQNNSVMVGITHAKFNANHPGWQQYRNRTGYVTNMYVSRFIAYQPVFPFDIVARSGWFCLGFADADEAGSNTLAGRNTQHRLLMFNETYSCPYIQFPSGFSEVVGDSAKAIIAYGINDCHPRMMMVKKDDIARLLLG